VVTICDQFLFCASFQLHKSQNVGIVMAPFTRLPVDYLSENQVIKVLGTRISGNLDIRDNKTPNHQSCHIPNHLYITHFFPLPFLFVSLCIFEHSASVLFIVCNFVELEFVIFPLPIPFLQLIITPTSCGRYNSHL
jgi:hypothetical protein